MRNKSSISLQRNKGFSLIELMVVVAVISLLAAGVNFVRIQLLGTTDTEKFVNEESTTTEETRALWKEQQPDYTGVTTVELIDLGFVDAAKVSGSGATRVIKNPWGGETAYASFDLDGNADSAIEGNSGNVPKDACVDIVKKFSSRFNAVHVGTSQPTTTFNVKDTASGLIQVTTIRAACASENNNRIWWYQI